MDEEFKLAHEVVDVAKRANRKICVTLLRYIVNKLEISIAQVWKFARRKEDCKLQQNVYLKYVLEFLSIYLV